MTGQRNVAVSIGVANADKLRYLGAAVNGASGGFFDSNHERNEPYQNQGFMCKAGSG